MELEFDADDFDALDALAIPAGAIVAAVGLLTLVGMPWVYANSVVVTVAQVLGSVLAIAFGVALAWYVYAAE